MNVVRSAVCIEELGNASKGNKLVVPTQWM